MSVWQLNIKRWVTDVKMCIRVLAMISVNCLLLASNSFATSLINQQYGFESYQNGYIGASRHDPYYLGTDEYDSWSGGMHNWQEGFASGSTTFSLPATSSPLQFVSVEFDIWHFLSYQTVNVLSFDSPKTATGRASVKLVDYTLQGVVLWEYNYMGYVHDEEIFHDSLTTSFWLDSTHQYELLYDSFSGVPSPFPITNVVYGQDGEEGYAHIDFFNMLQTDIQINAVPEPSTVTLMILGILGGLIVRKRRS